MDRMGERIGAFQKIFRTVPPHQFVSIEKMRPKYCGSVERSCNSKLIVVCTRPPKKREKENFSRNNRFLWWIIHNSKQISVNIHIHYYRIKRQLP